MYSMFIEWNVLTHALPHTPPATLAPWPSNKCPRTATGPALDSLLKLAETPIGTLTAPIPQ